MTASEGSRVGSNLIALFLNPRDYSFICALRKPALLTSFLIIFVPGTESLGSKVEGVAERLVDTAQDICPGYEHLGRMD